jgi:hypothetical protein
VGGDKPRYEGATESAESTECPGCVVVVRGRRSEKLHTKAHESARWRG